MITREEVKKKVIKAISTTSQHWHFNGKFFYTVHLINFDKDVCTNLKFQMRSDHLIVTVDSFCHIDINVSQEFSGEDCFEQCAEWVTDYVLTVSARLNQHAERLAELSYSRDCKYREYNRIIRSVLP